ncbi:MAG: inositol monophosphatase family protein [Acidimicrobiales bacterium]
MDPELLLQVLSDVASRVRSSLDDLDDWGPSGGKPGQYRSDVAADAVALEVLVGAGLSVLSEESGVTGDLESELLAVLDPVDGSTNASRGIPWYATSICVLDREGPLCSLVVNQADGTRYEAVRGQGALRDGAHIGPGVPVHLDRAVVGLAGYPPRALGWRQFRALGAAALDLCAVADGTLDAYVDCSADAHGPWDYLGGFLVCREAGAHVADAEGRELVLRTGGERRLPVAASSRNLLEEMLSARRAAFSPEAPAAPS